MKNIKLLFLLPFLTFIGCKNSDNQYIEVLKPKLKILEGSWKEATRNNYTETWAFSRGDTLLCGEAFSESSGVLKRTEKLAIVRIDTSVYYQATVEGQNQGATISFKLVKTDDFALVFENPEHDFPQQISYHFLDDSTISVKVGNLADTSNNFNLMMKKEKLHQKMP